MLAHRRYDLELVHCYSWSTKRWYSPLRFQLRLSAAYYVSLNLAYAGHHGLVGLGLSECQDCVGETADTAPSFLRAIQQHALGVLPESNTRHAGGKAMFFAIRPPLLPHEAARTDPEKATSWMAINRWPCVAQPTWSDDIPLSPSEDPVAGRWSVRVESMSFVRGGTSTLSETVHTIRFEGGFLDMLLDTGCSVTWVPLQVINDIREHVFPNPDNPDLDLDLTGRGAGNISHPDFKAPYDASRNDLNNWRVEFYFKGFKEPVKVQCPIEDFICTKSQDPGSNVRDGLLYALPANYVGTPNMGILGLVRLLFLPNRARSDTRLELLPSHVRVYA
ncbi:hypothetical protein C8Q76DRAFT_160337 [Earliella scabrosa]|nr:hypothetical protein C8Q76DRAFT_160337 [Earliella scabrosa]